MSSLRALYHELIVDHGKSPRNFGPMPEATGCQEGFNPLCGDKVKMYVCEQDGVLKNLSFEGQGCAISMASASLMTDALLGKSLEEVEIMFARFHQAVTEKDHSEVFEASLGKLIVFKNLAEYPVRVKCATLAWHTLKAALRQDSQPVNTEKEDG